MQEEGETLDKIVHCEKCHHFEDERDLLHSSLFALTTRFAQVQLRLRQIIGAPFGDQEKLLKDLEDFAFSNADLLKTDPDDGIVDEIECRRSGWMLLLRKLKFQLKELKVLQSEIRKADMNRNLLLNHLRRKEALEMQLKDQIVDLERFIQHLTTTRCACKEKKSFTSYLVDFIRRSISVLGMLALIEFNRGLDCFKLNRELTHWGDLRAKLELAILDLRNLLVSREDPYKITILVRTNLASSIRDLIQHGTRTQSVLLLDNFTDNSSVHGWDIILYYYNFKKGDKFNSATIQKLSKSFNLSIAGTSSRGRQKNLLCVVENIVSSHSKYRRSHDSQFKAFICAALNGKNLVRWLDSIFQCGSVIDAFYYPWSYVANTRYKDGLESLDTLTQYKFDLPVDLAVRRFQTDSNLFSSHN